MSKGLALVQMHVSPDPDKCVYSDADCGCGEYVSCQFLKPYMQRVQGGRRNRKTTYEPRCMLFKEWLEGDKHFPNRCYPCKVATGELEGD